MDAQHFWIRQLQEIGDKFLASHPVIRDGETALETIGTLTVYSYHVAIKLTSERAIRFASIAENGLFVAKHHRQLAPRGYQSTARSGGRPAGLVN